MNTKAKGEKAVLIAIGEMAKLDIPVLIPLSDNLRFDFVIFLNNKLLKVQVKSSERTTVTGAIEFKLCSNNWYKGTIKKYNALDCDIMLCYDHVSQNIYILSPKDFENRNSFTLRKHVGKNGQSKRLNLENDFLLTIEKLMELAS